MELTFVQQSVAFACSLLLGVGLGVVYGLLKLMRFAFSPADAAVFALDLLFMLTWALSVFIFSLGYLLGYVRVYVLAGSLLGFFLYRLTFGRLLCRIYRPIVRVLRRALQKICEKTKIFAKYLLKISGRLLYNIRKNSTLFRQRISSKKQSDSEKRKDHEKQKIAGKITHKKDGGASRSRHRRQKRSESR